MLMLLPLGPNTTTTMQPCWSNTTQHPSQFIGTASGCCPLPASTQLQTRKTTSKLPSASSRHMGCVPHDNVHTGTRWGTIHPSLPPNLSELCCAAVSGWQLLTLPQDMLLLPGLVKAHADHNPSVQPPHCLKLRKHPASAKQPDQHSYTPATTKYAQQPPCVHLAAFAVFTLLLPLPLLLLCKTFSHSTAACADIQNWTATLPVHGTLQLHLLL